MSLDTRMNVSRHSREWSRLKSKWDQGGGRVEQNREVRKVHNERNVGSVYVH